MLGNERDIAFNKKLKLIRQKVNNNLTQSILEKRIQEMFDVLTKTSSNNTDKLLLVKKEVSKVEFGKLIPQCPVFLMSRIFDIFDKRGKQSLSYQDFSSPLKLLAIGGIEDIAKIIFKFLDLNSDGIISFIDMKLLLSMVSHDGGEKQLTLDNNLAAFNMKDNFNFYEFYSLSFKEEMDIVIFLFDFLYRLFPVYSEEYSLILQKLIMLSKSKSLNGSSTDVPEGYDAKVSFGSPLSNYDYNIKSPVTMGKASMYRDINTFETKKERNFKISCSPVKKSRKASNLPPILPVLNGKDKMTPVLNLLKSPKMEPSKKLSTPVGMIYDFQTPKRGFESKSPIISPIKSAINCDKTIFTEKNIEREGEMYTLNFSVIHGKSYLNPVYLVLQDKVLYYFKSNEHRNRREVFKTKKLEGVFVRLNKPIEARGDIYENFTLIEDNKEGDLFFHKTKSEMAEWVKSLRKANNYRSVFEKYSFKNEVNTGAFGKVCKGREISNPSEEVAIKVIHKYPDKLSLLKEIQTEVEILKLSLHNNIVKYVDYYENSVYGFIVTEYLKNGTLKSYLSKRKYSLDESEKIKIIYKVAKVLQVLHSKKIVHRDIKLSNIMLANSVSKDDMELGRNLDIKIIDFGLSKFLLKDIKTNGCYGTIEFAPPEVFTGSKITSSIDIWSLGVVVYNMFYGKVPFKLIDGQEKQCMKTICTEEVDYPKDIDINPLVLDLMRKCLVKEPNKRPNIDEILSHSIFKYEEEMA